MTEGDEALRIAREILDGMGVGQEWRLSVEGSVREPLDEDEEPALITTIVLRPSRGHHGRTESSGGGRGYATLINADSPDDSNLLTFVENIHDHLLEEYRGRPVPECPGHPHPQAAAVVDGVVVWGCPRTANREN